MNRITQKELFHNINVAVEVLRDSSELLGDEIEKCTGCTVEVTCWDCRSYHMAINHIADSINCLEKSFGLCEIRFED